MSNLPSNTPQDPPLTADECRATIAQVQRTRRQLAQRADLLALFPAAGYAEAAQVLAGDHPYVQLLYEQRAAYLKLRAVTDDLWKHGDTRNAARLEQTCAGYLKQVHQLLDSIVDVGHTVAQDMTHLTEAAEIMTQRRTEHADKISVMRTKSGPQTLTEEALLDMAGIGMNQVTSQPRQPTSQFNDPADA